MVPEPLLVPLGPMQVPPPKQLLMGARPEGGLEDFDENTPLAANAPIITAATTIIDMFT